MGWTEFHGNSYRARWRTPDGKIKSQPGFRTKREADKFWKRQEAALAEGRYISPDAGKITVAEWANIWFGQLNVEPATESNYRYHLEHFILPAFGDRPLDSLTRPEIDAWEKAIVEVEEKSLRTAQDARTTFSTCLGDAVPERILRNPAARPRARGKKAERRMQRRRAEAKAWATPLEAFLLAERAAAISGRDDDFVKLIAKAYTGARWSEIVGLRRECVHLADGVWELKWKIYELGGKFIRGWPKDGSVRVIDVPPFLNELISWHLEQQTATTCTCSPHADEPYCSGGQYVFLGPQGGHPRRSNYVRRIFRAAADGRWPAAGGNAPQPALPVLADVTATWPGKPLVTLPPPGWVDMAHTLMEEIRRQGVQTSKHLSGTARELLRRLHDMERVGPYKPRRQRERASVAAWLPLVPQLTPHGLRHSHETWMAEDRIPDVLRDERMGHSSEEEPDSRRTMRDRYTRISDTMRAELIDALQKRWEASLEARAELERHWDVPLRSPVRIVNILLEPYRARRVERISAGRAGALKPLRSRRPRLVLAASR